MKEENKKKPFYWSVDDTRADVPWLITKSNRSMKRVLVI